MPEFSLIENYTASRQESKVYNTRICARICELAEKFCRNHTAEEMKDTLTRFYKEYGVGKFGLHKSFRIVHDETGVHIEPILNIAHVNLKDIVGYEIPKKKLVENTTAFVSGRKANNCLLFGDAGTGKSSCIKAIANEYYGDGLRIIEVYKHQFQDLNEVIAQIKNRNYRFIIYMDDLSFEEFEIEYKYLKAVIEGGLEKKPENVLIYATSNRRHLIRENYRDKEESPGGYAYQRYRAGKAVTGIPVRRYHLFWGTGQKTVPEYCKNTGGKKRYPYAGTGTVGGSQQVGTLPRRPLRTQRPTVCRLPPRHATRKLNCQ